MCKKILDKKCSVCRKPEGEVRFYGGHTYKVHKMCVTCLMDCRQGKQVEAKERRIQAIRDGVREFFKAS